MDLKVERERQRERERESQFNREGGSEFQIRGAADLNDRLANDVRRSDAHGCGTDDDRVLRALVFVSRYNPVNVKVHRKLHKLNICFERMTI